MIRTRKVRKWAGCTEQIDADFDKRSTEVHELDERFFTHRLRSKIGSPRHFGVISFKESNQCQCPNVLSVPRLLAQSDLQDIVICVILTNLVFECR